MEKIDLSIKNFLFENFLRGVILQKNRHTAETFDDQYKKRAECEKIHGHIKGVQ